MFMLPHHTSGAGRSQKRHKQITSLTMYENKFEGNEEKDLRAFPENLIEGLWWPLALKPFAFAV